jgi:hypothetical protein
MSIEEFKNQLCELIDSAYATAKTEQKTDIIYPFAVRLGHGDQVEYQYLRPPANHPALFDS